MQTGDSMITTNHDMSNAFPCASWEEMIHEDKKEIRSCDLDLFQRRRELATVHIVCKDGSTDVKP
eukprot:8458076-Lingulodinium_polyedra.AAC.1